MQHISGIGYDHDLFQPRTLRDPAPFSLPDGSRLVVAISVVLQRFPIDGKPAYAVPGQLSRPWPDFGNAAQRETGLHEGLWRILDAVEHADIDVSFVVESDALPFLTDLRPVLAAERHALICGGKNAASLHGPHLSQEAERDLIAEAKAGIEAFGQRAAKGWRSPSNAQSIHTLGLLAEAGFQYCGDFNNDERPYHLAGAGEGLWATAMPHTTSDLHCIEVSRQPARSYFEAQIKGAEWMLASSAEAPFVLPLVLHPWITGVPHRIGAFESLLRGLKGHDEVVFWNHDRLIENCRG